VFAAVINSTKSALTHVIRKYVARASVAIPFVLALGFILAAIATMLVERFGTMGGYWIMSGALVALGVIAAVAVSVRARRAENGEGRPQPAKSRQEQTPAV